MDKQRITIQNRRAVIKRTAGAALMLGTSAMDFRDARRGQTLCVENLDLALMSQGWGTPTRNRSVGGRRLIVGGQGYQHGVGTHAESIFRINLKTAAVRFTAKVGLDDEVANQGAVVFEVLVDGQTRARTPIMRGGNPARGISVNLRGAGEMTLLVVPAAGKISYDHADWLDPVITLVPGAIARPEALPPNPDVNEYPDIADGDPETPEFHGPRIIGATPGCDFLFKVPHTGRSPVTIFADGLPIGLRMDSTGMITGKIQAAGSYSVRLTAANSLGTAHRTLRVVAGEHQLARTPPMGWNSWNAYGIANDARRTRAAADAMVKSGLASKGFTYINIDDGWQNGRGPDGEIRTTARFGNMKQLADYVHSHGLRFGIYSSPGPKTCGNHTGSFGHELQDARTYAKWGVDYLKYDWCSYAWKVPKHPDLGEYIKPYRIMREALNRVGRDIFFSLCQYGMGHVWTWGGETPVWGNSYRISGDITDSWRAMTNNGFSRNGMLFPFAGPGHWNDPDMLVVGYGHFEDGPLHRTKLTPHEQLTHITLWCMQAAPLLLGCDLEKLDNFTIKLMTNTEVLAVNQDELGSQAQRVDRRGSIEVWARPLWDGTVAVAVFNLGLVPRTATIASWEMLEPVLPRDTRPLRGPQPVRDLWKRKSLGSTTGFQTEIPVHSAVMLKVGAAADIDD